MSLSRITNETKPSPIKTAPRTCKMVRTPMHLRNLNNARIVPKQNALKIAKFRRREGGAESRICFEKACSKLHVEIKC
uniref:Uncharacterized protein n=1 Tax=Romanomermis culicivorax TaxID=13658 RepID=A0A915JSR0_ROMCU